MNIKKIFEFLIVFSFSIVFFSMPTFYFEYNLQGFEFDKQLGFWFWVLVALFGWLLKSGLERKIVIRRTPLDIPIFIFWFSCLVSTIFSIDRWHSFFGFFDDPTHGFLNITMIIIAYYTILSNFKLKWVKFFLGAIFIGAMFVLSWEFFIVTGFLNLQDHVFIQKYAWLKFIPSTRIGSITGTTVFLSGLVILLITVFIKLKVISRKKFLRNGGMALVLIMLVISLYLLLVFNSFVLWVSLLLGLGFFIFYIFSGKIEISRRLLWLPMFVFGCVAVFYFFGNFLLANISLMKVELPVEVGLQTSFSRQIAKESLVKNNLLFGSGPATYGFNFSLFRPKEFNLNNFYNVRFYKGSGVLWEMLPTLGIFGTLSFLSLVIFFLITGVYLLNRKIKKDRIYSLGFMSLSISMLTNIFFVRIDGSLIILSSLFFVITLGIVLEENYTEDKYLKFSLDENSVKSRVSAFVFLLTVVMVIFSFIFLTKFFIADVFAGAFNKSRNNIEEDSVKMIEKAILLNDKEGRYLTLCGQKYLLLAKSEIAKKKNANNELIKNYLDKANFYSLKGKEMMPKDVVAIETYAQVLESKSLYFSQFNEDVIEEYKKALSLEPHNANYFLRIGKIYVLQAEAEKNEENKKRLFLEAKNWFEKAIFEKENFSEAYFQMSKTQYFLGEKDEAIYSIKKAIAINGTKIEYFLMLANLYQLRGEKNDFNNAEDLYKKLIALGGDNIDVKINLGLLYEKMKKFNEALMQYKDALKSVSDEKSVLGVKISKMIINVEQGIENVNEKEGSFVSVNN